ncbi:hypothetical protein B7494_g7469 [Chlorociboria aeruginascens]|nr:hypothetical protein B7494_g7469 [Chlorociboria aeruginascens]
MGKRGTGMQARGVEIQFGQSVAEDIGLLGSRLHTRFEENSRMSLPGIRNASMQTVVDTDLEIESEKELEIQDGRSGGGNKEVGHEKSRGDEVDIEVEALGDQEKGLAGYGRLVATAGDLVRKVTTRSSWIDPGPPPDGGLNAWMQDVSWIGSLQVFLLFFIGTFTGRLTDAGYFRSVFLVGTLVGTIGLFMTSLSITYWQLLLAQGVCCGIGNGCLFCPTLALLSTYFDKKKSLVMAIAAAGSATGGMIFPAIVKCLLPGIGFPWTMRALGFIQLACLAVCSVPFPAKPKSSVIELKSKLTDKNFWGVYFPFYYLGSFARSIIGLPYSGSVNLIIVLNGVGLIGRVIPGYVADKYFGPMNLLVPVVFITSMICLLWIRVTSRGGLYAWAVLYGFVGAAIQSLFPATLSSLTTDLRMAGTRMGMVFTVVSFAVLTGPPLAGVLIQKGAGEYKYAQTFAGLDLLLHSFPKSVIASHRIADLKQSTPNHNGLGPNKSPVFPDMSAYSITGNNYPHPTLHGPGRPSVEPLAHNNLPMSQTIQFNPQQQPQPPYHNGHVNEHTDEVQQGHSGNGSGSDGQKGNRLRKACDSCSIRKVKCDEAGPPCRACSALDIPCTFERPSRRRGPPNRHAEAIKKRRLDDSPGAGSFSSPTSPNNVAATLASFSSHAVLSAESICPFSTLELLVDDFFTYIHPLAPFPHEPSFRAAFKHREDVHNPAFLALLASMVGSLVASFPRKPRLHLKAQHREHLFPNSISLVERCHRVAVEARGTGYLDKELSVYDAATSYFLGLAGAYTFNWRQCRLYFGETLNIARVLGAHKLQDTGGLTVGALPTAFGAEDGGVEAKVEPIDYIRQEIGRRVFWIMSMQQLGATFGELLIPPPTPNEPYPPLPMEVDDEYIYVDHVDSQPPGIISKLTGFNLGIQIYMTCTPLATIEMAYGIDEVFDWNRQKIILEECLSSVKRVLDIAPRELMLQTGSQPGIFAPSDRQYYPPPMLDYPSVQSHGNDTRLWLQSQENVDTRRQLQYEIQKANIYASQLGTRSYIVEKYWNLQDAYNRIKANSVGTPIISPGVLTSGLDEVLEKGARRNDGIETNVASERESIVKDLLQVLGSISQVNMEPNGGSFINKIRQIASTLIGTPQNRKGPLALKSEEYLARFLDVLMKLERAKCEFTSLADVGVAPCVRCKKENQQCQFLPTRRGGNYGNGHTARKAQARAEELSAAPEILHEVEQPCYTQDTGYDNVPGNIHPLAEAPLCNPLDALEILAHVSLCRQDGDSDYDEDEGESQMFEQNGCKRADSIHANPSVSSKQSLPRLDETGAAAEGTGQRSDVKSIDDFLLIKLGLINPTQLRTYVSIYISRHNHYVPIIPEYRLSNNDNRIAQFASKEPFLLMVIILIVSRYEKDSIHVSCWNVVRGHLSQITYGGLPTISVVEGLLLLSEYLPSLPNVADNNFHQVEASMSWNLIGLAIRHSYFLGLDQRALLDPTTIQDEQTSRERLVWTYCYLFDRQISIRLGKAFWSRGGLVFRSQPAANTSVNWEAHNNFPTLAPNYPYRNMQETPHAKSLIDQNSKVSIGNESTLVQAYLELTQILTNIHSTLYPSRDRTLALSHVGEYTRMLDEFTRTLTWFRITWIEKHRWEKSPYGETISATFYYAKLYAYSFAFQAHVQRATANSQMLSQDADTGKTLVKLIFPRGLAESPDVKYILEAIDSASALLKICVEDLFPQGALGFLPSRFYGYFSYAAVFLMKVVLTEAVVFSERERIMRLISNAITAIQSSSSKFTKQHIGVRSSRQLKTLFRTLIAVTGTDLISTPSNSYPEATEQRPATVMHPDGDFAFWLNMLEANPTMDAAASIFLSNSPSWLPDTYMQEMPNILSSTVDSNM